MVPKEGLYTHPSESLMELVTLDTGHYLRPREYDEAQAFVFSKFT